MPTEFKVSFLAEGVVREADGTEISRTPTAAEWVLTDEQAAQLLASMNLTPPEDQP